MQKPSHWRLPSPCPSAETLLFCASRAQLVNKVIRPALERGAWVLSDRFYDSTYAYQGYGRGYDIPTLRAMMEFAVAGTHPTLTFLLEADTAVENARLEKRFASGAAADWFEREADAFHVKVRRGFRELAAADPGRFRVVATDGPIAVTARTIWTSIAEKFGLAAS